MPGINLLGTCNQIADISGAISQITLNVGWNNYGDGYAEFDCDPPLSSFESCALRADYDYDVSLNYSYTWNRIEYNPTKTIDQQLSENRGGFLLFATGCCPSCFQLRLATPTGVNASLSAGGSYTDRIYDCPDDYECGASTVSLVPGTATGIVPTALKLAATGCTGAFTPSASNRLQLTFPTRSNSTVGTSCNAFEQLESDWQSYGGSIGGGTATFFLDFGDLPGTYVFDGDLAPINVSNTDGCEPYGYNLNREFSAQLTIS